MVAWLLLVEMKAYAAFWLFILAMLTDLVDGWLARKLGADPRIGALLDPLSDKILVGCAWGALWAVGWAPWWLVVPSLLRDLVVATVWQLARGKGRQWEASAWGQVMVSFEGTSIGILLFHGPYLGVHWPSVGVALGIMGLALSMLSVVDYLVRGPGDAQ